MTDVLILLLRMAGVGLIALSLLHFPMATKLKWGEDTARMSAINASVFQVHTFFICLVLILMGLPCLIDPGVFLIPTPAGAWVTWSIAVFWAARLYCQFFVYRTDLWRGKRMETTVHLIFTCVWSALTALFTTCGAFQSGWLK